MFGARAFKDILDALNLTVGPIAIWLPDQLSMGSRVLHSTVCPYYSTRTLAMYARRMNVPAATTVSSLTTYSSWDIAVARSPVPRTAVPVLVMRFGEDGRVFMISDARSEGGGFDVLIARLHD